MPVVFAICLAPGDWPLGGSNADRLESKFEQYGYRINQGSDLGHEVPRVFIRRFPDDWPDLKSSARRKQLFVGIKLPLILEQNRRVLADRTRILNLVHQIDLTWRDERWLRHRAQYYGVGYGQWARLLNRVDQVPPSLALAQGAIESGWGTSRFVQEGNAVFGQWTWSQTNAMTPDRRASDATHSISRFPSLGRSVAAYVHNLNTHPAYAQFRARRVANRLQGAILSGFDLALTLDQYAETGQDYVVQLQELMTGNHLGRFDDDKLALPSR